jgi:hypothetical protein
VKLKQVTFNEEEDPETVEFVLTVEEAALLYAFVGRVSPNNVTDAAGDKRWGDALAEIAGCLSGSFFNRFWEGGAADVAPNLSPSVGGRK